MDKYCIEDYRVKDKLFNCDIVKITEKCIYIKPTCPLGKSRYTKKECQVYLDRKMVRSNNKN